MLENILEKGAVIQKDMETYAIIPYIPGGLVDSATLIKIANIAEKYHAKTLKVTSNQRIAIIGIKYGDIDKIWEDLDMKPEGFIGKKVRSAKFCPGTTYCKKGEQDAVKMGMEIDENFQGMELPNKIKIGVSGCKNSCAESAVKDIGLIGTKRGWNLLVGGICGIKPMIGQTFATNLSDGEVLGIISKIIEHYKENEENKRLGRFINKIGFEKFKSEII
ncbi:NAD(P)/FAD-dependent oxidoreductase [Methanobacterium sp. MBAC-LM]|uniref:NAD(P)/FAD-dependent oxidoreductase n=1 Tax=Methanobacterium sp. MBAC-LM TaxID=3412034 RepID=UPI003C71D71B